MTQGFAWGKEHLWQFGAIDSQLDSHLTAKIDDNLQTSASVLWKVRATRWLGKWSLKKKNRAVPAWFSLAPSELVRTVHSQQANGKGRDVQERSEGKRDNRAQVQDAQLKWAVSGFCPLETVRLGSSLLVSLRF